MFLNQFVLPVILLFTMLPLCDAGAVPQVGGPRCGGDGPNPLSDITAQITFHTEEIPTDGSPEEFVVWQNRGKIVYRTEAGEVWEQPLTGGTPFRLATAPGPLLPVFDPAERFLITRSGRWVFDAWQKRTWAPAPVGAKLTPLFSSRDSVFGVVPPAENGRRSVWRVARVAAENGPIKTLCPLLNLASRWRLAQGSHYPYVYLFATRGKHLSLRAVNVEECTWQDSVFPHSIEGEVRSVFFFTTPGSLAVHVERADQNRIWYTAKDSCGFFDIDESKVLQVNPEIPILATESEAGSFTLIDLSAATKATLITDEPELGVLRPQDAFLTRDRKQLLLKTENEPFLIKIRLP